MKDRSNPGGNRGIPGSEIELRVCVFWLSWLRTGDSPMSTGPWDTLSQDEASKACNSWVVMGAPWCCQSLPVDCIIVLLPGAGAVLHESSGNEAWLQVWALMSGQSERAHSEAVSGGVNGYPSAKGMEWHQLSTSDGWEKSTDPGWEYGEYSSLNTYTSVKTRQHLLMLQVKQKCNASTKEK